MTRGGFAAGLAGGNTSTISLSIRSNHLRLCSRLVLLAYIQSRYSVLAIEIKDCNFAKSECLNNFDEKLNSSGLPGSTWSHPEDAWVRLCRDVLKTMTKK